MNNYVGRQFGNYRLTSLLGQGGFSEVYLAKHIHLSTQAAIKVSYTQLAHNDKEVFHHEARILALLIHPHIIRVLEFGIEKSVPYLVMDYAPNGTLHKRHPPGVPLAPSTVLSYVKQIADALEYIHGNYLIHRDIKPQNLLLGKNDNVLLSDFGIAILARTATTADIPSMQGMLGTMAYIAPEQLMGNACYASDQYALGVIIYEWLSSHYLFRGTSPYEIGSQHLFATPPPLRTWNPNISVAVEEVVLKALAKNPNDRFPSIQAFAAAFENASKSDDQRTMQLGTEDDLVLQAHKSLTGPITTEKSAEIFCCYFHRDQSLLNDLKTHLFPLQRQGIIKLWNDTEISAGTEWEEEIDKRLNTAQIILLLVSPDFIASEYCYSKEMKRAMERHEKGEAQVIPIILRPVYWQGTPFGKLQALPAGAKPVTTWQNPDEAFLSITEGIQRYLNKFLG